MSVPLKSKLSYIWARATHKDRIYSHVFEKKVSIPVFAEFSDDIIGYDRGTVSAWLKAVPLEGQTNQFLISTASYQRNLSGVSLGGKYKENQSSGVYSSEQVQAMFEKWETEQLKLRDVLPTPRQPFKSYIRTKLTARG